MKRQGIEFVVGRGVMVPGERYKTHTARETMHLARAIFHVIERLIEHQTRLILPP